VTWDGSKGGEFWRTREKEEDEIMSFRKKIRGTKGICSRKPQIMF